MPFRGMAEEFAALARELAKQPDLPTTLAEISRLAVATVEGAEFAAVTVGQGHNRFRTVGATGELALAVDQIQYDTEEGPCIDSLRTGGRIYRCDDVACDPRWPVFGRLASERTEVVSMLSHRLYLEDDNSLGALNLYSRKPAAFTDQSLSTLDMLATHAAIAFAKADAEEQSKHLQIALTSNRTVGVAVGILMAMHKVTQDQAFDLLRLASQHSHRKLHEIARDVADTGTLDLSL